MYFTYNAYIDARDRFKRSEHNSDDKARFRKIIDRISKKPDVRIWEEKLFTTLHKYLAVYNGFTIGYNDYCRYINFWLNEEIRKSGYEKYLKYFDFFKDFVDNYAYVNQGNYTRSCKAYIHNMEQGDYNRMKLLYDFFDMYSIIKSKNYAMNDDTCAKLYINTVYYNAGIDDYYDNHPDFYNKISQVKNLIEENIKNLNEKCTQIKTFIKPQKLLEEQRKEEERKQAEKLKKELEEAEQLKKDLERKEQERLNRERQEFEDQERMKQNQKAIEFQQEVSKLTVDPRSVRESVDIGVLEQSTLPKDRVSLDPSGRFRISEAEIPEGYGIQSVEIDYLKEGNARTEPKTFLGSTGFPGYITDVFRSVEPAPILGVSGGMGALFLLFKVFKVLKL
ncbi:hypothetical protein PVNG_05856 [Plasmodium vivax North Korean]|uniref:VIR protein n=1 Tax=Plasmodium vivax North Korean TaxID=1035514 RepID=A0A0J9TKE5_PLAVI|nr:hypothetical protein PVNG_05856 [Plasmodium vivax North Korean]